MSVLSASGLMKQYKARRVVNHVHLRVCSGEVVGLLGPNGAGKTTSFYMMVGLIAPDEGDIFLDREVLTRMPMHQRALQGIGYLPQEPSIFRRMSVINNVLAILETRRDLNRAKRYERLEELISELNLHHVRDSLGMSLSGGERRRVEIARALAAQPRFMLLDEPFAGIDPISVLDIQNLINHLRSLDIGVLITDHNVRETLGICDRAYIVSAGAIIAEGTPTAVLQDHKVRDVYLGHNFRL